MEDLTEAKLVEHCMEGSEAAWREMVRRFQGLVYGVSLRILKDPDEARDAAQESLIKALRGLHTFETGHKLRPWLAKIAWNHSVRVAAKRRKNLVALEEPNPDESWSPLPDPAMVTERNEMGRALIGAVNQLPTAMQIVLEMRCAQGMDYREIASATGWPIGTVKTNLFRARKRLIESMATPKEAI